MTVDLPGSKVLEGVPGLDWAKGDLTLVGALMSLLEFVGEDVSKDYVMGVSGGAFKLLWHPSWCPSSGDLGLLGEEPVRRTFTAVGGSYELVERTGQGADQTELRRRLRESINAGVPVLAFGVVGPETCIIAGYEQNGDVALGHSYFHDGSQGYFRKPEWTEEAGPSEEVGEFCHACHGLVIVGGEIDASPRRQALLEALQWAVHLARAPERDGYASGLAAYDEWAAARGRDEDFPKDDPEALSFKCLVNANVVMRVLLAARTSAAAFLRDMTDDDTPGKDALLAAAASYEQEAAIIQQALEIAPHTWHPEERRRQMADPELRAKLAELILKAKEQDEQALEHLEQVLAAARSR